MKIPAEEKLLRLGTEWLERGGVRGMKVRGICAEAGVSPGTFTTHFKNLSNFADRVLERWYEPLKTGVYTQSTSDGNALVRLRAELIEIQKFFRKNAAILIQIFLDYAAGNENVRRIIQVAQANHIRTLLSSIKEATEKKFIISAPPEEILVYLFGALGMPIVVFNLLSEENPPPEMFILNALKNLAGEKATLCRMNWALKGICL